MCLCAHTALYVPNAFQLRSCKSATCCCPAAQPSIHNDATTSRRSSSGEDTEETKALRKKEKGGNQKRAKHTHVKTGLQISRRDASDFKEARLFGKDECKHGNPSPGGFVC